MNACCVQRNAPVRLTSTTDFHCSTVNSSSGALRVVMPAVMPSVLTGLILAMARAAGEVAPLMITGVVKLALQLGDDLHRTVDSLCETINITVQP